MKAEVMAWSEKTGIEMFRYGDHIMGIQGHPEYTKDILLHLIDRLLQLDLITVYKPSLINMLKRVLASHFESWTTILFVNRELSIFMLF